MQYYANLGAYRVCSLGLQGTGSGSMMLPVGGCSTVYMLSMLQGEQALLALAIHGLQCLFSCLRSGNKVVAISAVAAGGRPGCARSAMFVYPAGLVSGLYVSMYPAVSCFVHKQPNCTAAALRLL